MKTNTNDIRDSKTGSARYSATEPGKSPQKLQARGWRFRSFLRAGVAASELLFPAKCPVCGEVIPLERRLDLSDLDPAYYCCEGCEDEFDYVSEHCCEKCGKELGRDTEDTLCHDCGIKKRSFVQSRVLMTYDETAQTVLVGVKYQNKPESGRMLGVLAAKRLGAWVLSEQIDCIIPVPIHGERLKKRGYNQAELIAGGLGDSLGIPVNTRMLRRVLNTKAQKDLSAEMRLAQLEDAFLADTHYILSLTEKNGGRAPRVLLLDDIYTTGATMEVCTSRLIEAGIDSVYGLCIAAGRDLPRQEA